MAVVASLNIILKADVSNVIRNTTAGRKAFQRYGEDMKRLGRDITADLMTPLERMAVQEKKLQQLMAQGYISHQTYSRGLSHLKKEYDEVDRSAKRAAGSIGAASGATGGFNPLTGKSGGLGKHLVGKTLGSGFVKGGVAGVAISAVMPDVMAGIQERVQGGLNTIIGSLTGTADINQAMEKIAFGWAGYHKALTEHNAKQAAINVRTNAANAAMDKIFESSKSFEKTRQGVFRKGSASSEAMEGMDLVALLQKERTNTVSRRKSIAGGGVDQFIDPLAGVNFNTAVERYLSAVENETIKLRNLDAKIARTQQQITAIQAKQSRDKTADMQKEAEAQEKAFGKTEAEAKMISLQEQRSKILEQQANAFNSGRGAQNFGLGAIDKAIAAEQRLNAMEKEQKIQEKLKAIENSRLTEEQDRYAVMLKELETLGASAAEMQKGQKMVADIRRMEKQDEAKKEAKRKADESNRKQQNLLEQIVEDARTPWDKFFERLDDIDALAAKGKLPKELAARAELDATKQLASQFGLDKKGKAAALEFGTREAFSAQRDNPLVLTQKQIVDIARQQLAVQGKLLNHFEQTGEVVVGI